VNARRLLDRFGFLVLVVFIIVIPWHKIVNALVLNLAARNTIQGIYHRSISQMSSAQAALADINQKNCGSNWMLGWTERGLGNFTGQEQAWGDLVQCQEDYTPLLLRIAPAREDWAQASVLWHSQDARAWFWLASTRKPNNPQAAIQLYETGLRLYPFDTLNWIELGDLLSESDPKAAIQAYLHACLNGDPGSNGCYRAGLTAEQLGDVPSAIRYYRYSQWSGAQERANQLEQQLIEPLQP
jgi:tetratricopeptide (TPR) repeat protein